MRDLRVVMTIWFAVFCILVFVVLFVGYLIVDCGVLFCLVVWGLRF